MATNFLLGKMSAAVYEHRMRRLAERGASVRYVIVDSYAASREYCGSEAELIDVLREIDADAPGATADLFIVTYDDGERLGNAVGADDFLAAYAKGR